ncbi:GTPase IMAP family member 4 [Myotis davidii]|uniref:GTPase IMAP family member 4 n=1 Tax=Myotis davidii TaxID=225400 RepID=L5MJB5_MYODS|nr:GTPase IMAP family member 4 [Myotis davidii]
MAFQHGSKIHHQGLSEREQHVEWREIVIVDTPGILDTEVQDAADKKREIANCILLTSLGPHAVPLVIRLGWYTKEEQKAVEEMLSMFGSQAGKYMILLFTQKDDLEGMDFHDYLKEAPQGIQDRMEQFRNLHCEFNNKATGAEQEAQRAQLLDLVQFMVMENKGGCYTDEMYQRVEVEIQKQIQVKEEKYKAELEREKRQVKEKYIKKIRNLKDKLEQEKRKAEMEQELAERKICYLKRLQEAREEIESQPDTSILDIIKRITLLTLPFFFILFQRI